MDFEQVFDRRADGSIKWGKYSSDVIPLWVADMDFAAAPAIRQAIDAYVSTSVYGYAMPPQSLAGTVVDWFKKQYSWDIQPEWLVWLPSVLSGVGTAARMLGEGPNAVMTSIPVYRPFLDLATNEGRSLQAVPLLHRNGEWTMDFAGMEAAITPATRMYILCNPHNPTGRMYSCEELDALAAFCEKHDLLICSDEIHADIILDPSKKHIPIAALSEAAAQRSISLFSPGKAFNIPALGAAFAVIPNAELRGTFERVKQHTVPHMTLLAGKVTEAAYGLSEAWLDAALTYLRGNYTYLLEEMNNIPGLKMGKLEATYLAWIDYRELPVAQFAPLLEAHGVGVMEAEVFMGDGHIRLNFGTQRWRLEEAVRRIKQAVTSL